MPAIPNFFVSLQHEGDVVMMDCFDKMTAEEARAFRDAVLSIVAQIPPGRVMSYGLIATLAGWPSHARMVGRTLRYTPGAELLPCHRVVNVQGRTAPGWKRQRILLEEEGVTFKPNGHVDMSRHLWANAVFTAMTECHCDRAEGSKSPLATEENAY